MADAAGDGSAASGLTRARDADAAAWKKLSDGGPFRSAHWAAFVIFFAVFWWLNHTPRAAAGWIPVLIVFVAAFLPDAKRLSVGPMSWEAREQIAAARREIAQNVIQFHFGEGFGNAAVESAQARDTPAGTLTVEPVIRDAALQQAHGQESRSLAAAQAAAANLASGYPRAWRNVCNG